MITGFEEETQPLTEEEHAIVRLFVNSFTRRAPGEANAITSQEIIAKMELVGCRMTGARVRKIINYIRINKLVRNLVATSKGYYVESDPEKIREYVKGLKERAAAILAVAESFDVG
jgi:hypothetical protein